MESKHPIHEYVTKLTPADLSRLSNDGSKRNSQRLRTKVSKLYFKKYPKAPLTSLMRDVEQFGGTRGRIGISLENLRGTNLCYVNSCINLLLHSDKVLKTLKITQTMQL
jgi:hypothetical protein